MTPIHYLWVGPKPTDNKKGMDTMGADLMKAKYPGQEVHFWCLDSEVGEYKKHFQKRHGKDAVTVHGIESFIGENGDKDYLSFVERLKDRAHKFEKSVHKSQEMITIKDSFAYYLQLYQHGAIMDSSITPDDEFSKEATVPNLFDELNTFSASWVNDIETGERPDPWLMFAVKGDPTSENRFKSYLSCIKEHYTGLLCKGEEIPQHELVRPEITSEFVRAAKSSQRLRVKEHTQGLIKTSGIKKIYLNTHRTDTNTSKTHPLMSLLKATALPEVEYYIKENKIDPDTPLPYVKYNEEKRVWTACEYSLIGYIEEQIHFYDTSQKKARKTIDEIPETLEATIRELERKSAAGELSPKPSRRIRPNLTIPNDQIDGQLLPAKPKLTINIPARPMGPTISPHPKKLKPPLSRDERLKHFIQNAKIDSTSLLKAKERSLQVYEDHKMKLCTQMGMLLSYAEREDSLQRILALPYPKIGLRDYFERKIAGFDSQSSYPIFFDTLNALTSHLFSHLTLDAPKSLKTIDDLIDLIMGSPQKSAMLALTKSMLSIGPLDADNKPQYLYVLKSFLNQLSESKREAGASLFQSPIKLPFGDSKTDAFLDETINHLDKSKGQTFE